MKSNVILFAVGKTGVGKSYLLNHILHEELRKKRRGGIVILDLRGDHVDIIHEGFTYLKISGDVFNRYNINWVGVLEKYPNLIVVPEKLSMDEYGQLADDIAGGVVGNGNRVFVLEEAGIAMPVNSSQKRNLSVLIATGRGIGIDFFFTSQRPAQVSTTAVAEANIRICFSVDDPNDLKRMKSYIPEEELSSLHRFEYIAVNTFTHEKVKSDTYHLQAVDKIVWSSVL